MRRVFLQIIDIIVCLILCLPAQASNKFFLKKISVEDGLSNLSVLSIYQDMLGRMWLGTNEGVNVYDGIRVISYKSYVDSQSQKRRFINGSVNLITGDSLGNIFMRNNGNLIKYDIHSESFKEFFFHIDALDNIDNAVWCSAHDSLFRYNSQKDSFDFVYKLNLPRVLCMAKSDEAFWLGTSKGLYVKDRNGIKCILPNVEIFKLFFSSLGELWIASRMDGLYRIDKSGKFNKEMVSPSRVVSEQIRGFVEDDEQNIWFGTFDGLQSYNPYSDKYSVYLPDDNLGNLSHKSVFSLFKDKQGTIWIGTYYGGVNYFNLKKDVFKYYTYKVGSPYNLNFPIVGNMIEDAAGKIWICTDGGGINKLDRKTGKFTFYTMDDKSSILHNNIKSIEYDKVHNNIYIGTYTGGLCRYELNNNKFYNFLSDYNNKAIGPNSIIYSLKINGNWLYISAQNGFWRYNLNNHSFQKINSQKKFLNIEIDSYGYIWLATNYSLYRTHVNDLENLQLISLEDTTECKTKITSICETSDKTIYISTLGNGIYSYNNKKNLWKRYTASKDNLLSNYCYNIIETSSKNLLITSNLGLSIYSPHENKMLNSVKFALKGGISSVTDGCGLYVSKDSTVFVGGIDGMIAFKENDFLSKRDINTSFYFSDLYINNKRVTPNDHSNILHESLPFIKELNLNYNQNNIEIEFFFSNSVELEKNIKYQYKLDGVDDEWKSTEQMIIAYTNLSPGTYRLRLKNINDPESEIYLNIIIHRPWFLSIWAYILYALIIFSAFYIVLRIRNNRRILSLSLQKEKEEKERIEEMNKMKLRFFTNISHEFCTPLTLIITQIDLLLQSETFSGSVQKHLYRIRSNVQRLRLLINELLDFRKYSQGFMTLNVEYVDFIDYINGIFLSFEEVAKNKRINYTFEHIDESIGIWIDPVQFQKAVLNLLSNAFKYTPAKGNVKVTIAKKQNYIVLIIEDTGCGISIEDSKKIFERFYRADRGINEPIEGSGIGLALTKEIVEAHKGKIELESTLGKGSSFKVTLMQGNEHYSKKELEHHNVQITTSLYKERKAFSSLLNYKDEITNEGKEIQYDKELLSVLIVESDKELMVLLENIFSRFSKIYKSEDGLDAWNKVKEFHPDIVISEILLPAMSGKELCNKIKSNIDTASVSVVLLAAQGSVDDEVESYTLGADDYIVKPFNLKLLLAKCSKLMKNKLHKETVKTSDIMNDVTILNKNDRKLRDNAIAIIKQNFDNQEFDMDMLASELKIGRSTMFLRFKELFGMTPNELTLKLKLEEALRILKEEHDCNVSEISYRLGFNSPQYFSKSFKKAYGVSPQSYRKSLKANTSDETFNEIG